MIQTLFNLIVLLMLLSAFLRNSRIVKGEEVKPRKVTKHTLVFGLVMIVWAVLLIIF